MTPPSHALLTIATLLLAAPHLCATGAPDTLVIRVYATRNIASGAADARQELSVARAADEGRTILAQAGIASRWVICGSEPAPAECDAALSPAHLAVRLLAAPATRTPGTTALSLGYASAADGVLATVFADRVLALARRAGVDASVVTGRTMAHEVGHLLLASRHHTSSGLMRAGWSVDDLHAPTLTPWRFTPRDATELRASVARRLRHWTSARRAGTAAGVAPLG